MNPFNPWLIFFAVVSVSLLHALTRSGQSILRIVPDLDCLLVILDGLVAIGIARQHEDPLATDVDNLRKIVSYGLGVTYGSRGGLLVKGYVAARGGVHAQSDDSKARLYVLVSQQF